MITSRQNSRIMYLSSLNDSKNRKAHGKFLIEGRKLLSEALDAGIETEDILCTEAFEKENCGLLENLNYELISDSVLDKLSSQNAPDGIIACGKIPCLLHRNCEKADFNADEVIICACHIQDAGNLGTIIRTANAFGINHVILDDRCADLYNSKTLRGAMGGIFHMKISRCSDFPLTIEELKNSGRNVYAAALDRTAVSADKLEINRSDVFVIGNEGHGLDRKIIELCTRTVFIPMTEKAESLNASQAATIFMWELYKTRL